MSEHTLSCQARSIGDYDVVVCGGGPAGVGAAIAAAREGAKVLLVEQAGCLGGAGTNALVNVWHGNYTRDHKERVVAGIFQETVDRLVAEGGAIPAEKDVVNLIWVTGPFTAELRLSMSKSAKECWRVLYWMKVSGFDTSPALWHRT